MRWAVLVLALKPVPIPHPKYISRWLPPFFLGSRLLLDIYSRWRFVDSLYHYRPPLAADSYINVLCGGLSCWQWG